MTELEQPEGDPPRLGLPARLASFFKGLAREEAQAWRRLYRRYFKHAARALGVGFVAGFVYFMLRPDQEKRALEFVVRALEDIRLEGSPLVLTLTLFYHNARASVVAVAAGAVPFLFLPILDPLLNGGVLGLLVSVTKHQGFDVPRLILTQILPHGVFELTAILYATSLGLYLSAAMGEKASAAWNRRMAKPRSGTPLPPIQTAQPDFLERYAERQDAEPKSLPRNVIRSFCLVVLPLLLIAAFVEGFITPLLR